MQNPTLAADPNGEWFEVRNVSGADVDLDGLELSDLGTDSHTVSGSLVVADGARVVLGYSADPIVNGGANVDYAFAGAITLANGADELVLSFGGVTFDEVAWDDGATFPDPTGKSMNLDPAREDAVDNDDGANWCEATSSFGDLGTPGAANDPC
jgi:hypothetical protein